MASIEDFAGQIMGCNLVVTIDNSTAHVAGALGKRAWVLLHTTANWRWLKEREDSPWYPSLRLYRQDRTGTWPPVLERVTADLRALAEESVAPRTSEPENGFEFSRARPSRQYRMLIEHYSRMHEEGYAIEDGGGQRMLSAEEAYPGNELPKFIQPIKKLIDEHGARTILDYGAGKDRQYDPRTTMPDGRVFPDIKSYWGVERITCYDPAVPEHDTLPDTPSDGVVSTDMLEHCYAGDVPWIVREMFSLANRFVFANVACYPAKARLPSGENAHITIREPQWWGRLFSSIANEFDGRDFLLCCIAPMRDAAGKVRLGPVWIPRSDCK